MSELLTRLGTVGKTSINKVYDPACGSGSLLLKAEKILGREGVLNGFYGQEINITTYNLSVSTYVEAEDTREKIDIIKLNAEIKAIVKREDELRAAIREIIDEIEG